jgi:hypothetical protein
VIILGPSLTKTFLSCIFWNAYFFYFLVRKFIFDLYDLSSIFELWRLIFAFSTPKVLHVYIRSMDMSHDHADFRAQIPFLSSRGQFSLLLILKVYIFFIYIKFPIEWWVIFSFQFRDPADSMFFRAKHTQDQITKLFAFLDFWSLA